MPVSSPFLKPSSCVGPAHFFVASSHFTSAQSVLDAQPSPVGHFGAFVPPQSLPVSSPFFTPSVGDGAWHVPPVHTLLLQSAATAHFFPSSQAAAFVPPQSTSVSPLFCWPSGGATS